MATPEQIADAIERFLNEPDQGDLIERVIAEAREVVRAYHHEVPDNVWSDAAMARLADALRSLDELGGTE